MSRSKYDRQFKVMAVKLANGRGIKITAEELRINENSLRRWIKEYEEYGESAFPGNGNALLCYEYEIKKLEKQVDDLRTENEILKKFQAFLKQKSGQDSNS
jgi:transposase